MHATPIWKRRELIWTIAVGIVLKLAIVAAAWLALSDMQQLATAPL